jgi:hypothetical protein
MIPEKMVALLVAALANATWAAADIVDVRDRGPVDLASFNCTDITRSTIVDRVCYDAAHRYAILEIRSTYREFCNVPPAMVSALLNAPSMGQFYNARIRQRDPGDAHACADDATRRARSERSHAPAADAAD